MRFQIERPFSFPFSFVSVNEKGVINGDIEAGISSIVLKLETHGYTAITLHAWIESSVRDIQKRGNGA